MILPILRIGRKDLISIDLTAVFKDVAYKSRVRHQMRKNNFSFFLIWQGEKKQIEYENLPAAQL